MIYTVTLNPSIDYIVHVNHLEIGGLNRMQTDIKLPGGKGINVSRVLKRMSIESTAMGFIGGFTGTFISDWLSSEKIKTSFTGVKDDTRINIKLKSDQETEINGTGPVISDEEAEQLKVQFSVLSPGDIVILSGSTPPSLPVGFYKELIELVTSSGAEFVIDTTGEDLKIALGKRPLVVKPNNHELAELYQTSFTSVSDILPYGQQLLKEGAKYAIVSMAGDGALLFTKEAVYQSNVLNYPLKNSVGAGDSMIAGFVGKFSETNDPIEAFKWGVACGSATAFSDDLAAAELINKLVNEVKIKKM
ncbi:1-phosphofructokinase [Enterococcus sp. BWB1-3]|uniref:1-phosphofructokinase n=1 Tax=Enterococcus sp. BWB1-3 TaxID=2787713 RepID=UPI001923E758|nr:1-phosphofructokinase [Enterococcus sp. BWB1-3]MBL1229034.1 1-phosphofructokinase [Enterococcus sp. BWB1-3]